MRVDVRDRSRPRDRLSFASYSPCLLSHLLYLSCSNRSVENALTVRMLDKASVANPFATANAEKILRFND